MPTFGKRSQEAIETIHVDLTDILHDAIKLIDFSVICGHRSKEDQDKVFKNGLSKVQYPNSKHNSYPSLAVDIVPYPIDWKDRERFVYLAGIIRGVATAKGIGIRWGGDFNMNNDLHDQEFKDLPHFELTNTTL